MESSRIADYFVVIGCSPNSLTPQPSYDQPFPTNDPFHMTYTPEIMDRYPLEDRSDISLPTGLTLFCLPDGMHISTTARSPSFFSFVQTSESGAQLIGCCLTFHEELNDKQRASLGALLDSTDNSDISSTALKDMKLYLPRCLCLLSQWPFVSSFKKFLCHIYRLSLTPCVVPVERYICNFLDDVPAPPPGRVEVSYFIGSEVVLFKRPPANEPNAWSTMPMTPLFECLSLQNVVALFSAVLCERQIVFVSSQYSLLTSCAESIVSLMYPLKWTHVYIPILPRRLLGVLGAPLPIMVGIHSSFIYDPARAKASFADASSSSLPPSAACYDGYASLSSESVKVYLDENRIDFGSLGRPPDLPEGRHKKLLNDLTVMAPAFNMRLPDWEKNQLPFYDSAFEMSVRPDLADGTLANKDKVDEKGVRATFLKFFVSIMRDYKQYLITPTQSDPFPLTKFRTADYINDHPSDWTPLLEVLLRSQAFYQFVDARVSPSGWTDPEILFFDESIEAKINRYTFRLHKRDTPFLLDDSNKHCKTVVAPTVDADGLDVLSDVDEVEAATAGNTCVTRDGKGRRVYIYSSFPSLNPKLYIKKQNNNSQPRPVASAHIAQPRLSTLGRLKRANVLRIGSSRKMADVDSSSPESCVYSTFLIMFSRVVSCGLSPPTVRRAPPSLSQVLSKLNMTSPTNLDGRKSDPMTTSFTDNSSDLADKTLSRVDGDVEAIQQASVSKNSPACGDGAGVELNPPISELSIHTDCDTCPSPSNVTTDMSSNEAPSPKNGTTFSLLTAPGDMISSGTDSGGFVNYNDDIREEYVTIARAAIDIAFELFSTMESNGYSVDEDVYRALTDACAVCGAGERAVDVLESMTAAGMLPDMQITSGVARAISFSSSTSQGDEEASGLGLLPVTPKDVSEAAVNRDFRRLRKYCTASDQHMASPVIPSRDASRDHRMHSSPARVTVFTNEKESERNFFGFKKSRAKSSLRATAADNGIKLRTASDSMQSDACMSVMSIGTRQNFLSSSRFATQVLIADRTLDMIYPNLLIDLNNPNGTACPKYSCGKSLNILQIIAAFEPDANKYTVKCPYCGTEYVPRFTVHSSSDDWTGSEGEGSLLWCELLSPWVLQKEVLNVITGSGVETLLSSTFRNSSLNMQYAVIFWNLIIYFRLYGLPYAFLITEKSSMAFLIPLD